MRSTDFYAPPPGYEPEMWGYCVRLAKGTAALLRTLTGREYSPGQIRAAARQFYADEWTKERMGRG